MPQMGVYYFGLGVPAHVRRERVKELFNSLDMDGTLAAWRARQGIAPGQRLLAGLDIDIGAEGKFDFPAFVRAQQTGTRERRSARAGADWYHILMHINELPPTCSGVFRRRPLRGHTLLWVGSRVDSMPCFHHYYLFSYSSA